MKVYCDFCGHSITFYKRRSLICSHCRHKVFPTEKVKFIEKLTILMRKGKYRNEQSNIIG